MNLYSESFGTPPTTPMTPLDELALKRHRFFTNLLEAANEAISNNQFRFDQLESFELASHQRQSCSSTSTMTTNSK